MTILDDLCTAWEEWAAPRLGAGHCIAAAGALSVLARRAGIPYLVTAVEILAFNRAAVDLWDGGATNCRRWPPEAWSVGAAPGASPAAAAPGRYDGHVAVILDGTLLVDLSARQFTRPARGIITAPCWTDQRSGNEWILPLPGGGRIQWAPHPDRQWVSAPDWKRRRQYVDEFTAATHLTLERIPT